MVSWIMAGCSGHESNISVREVVFLGAGTVRSTTLGKDVSSKALTSKEKPGLTGKSVGVMTPRKRICCADEACSLARCASTNC